MSNRKRNTLAVALLLAMSPAAALAQHDHPPEPPLIGIHWGAQAVGLLTHATPAEAGRDLTEGYLTQPNIFLHMNTLQDRLRLTGTLNLEGLTLQRGELNAGTWGEGYVDRRHPHTYLHEAMLTAQENSGATEFSLSAGRGFAPFGTDDPMVRPFVKFPANHHLSQILERIVLIGAVRHGPVLLEAAWFNGNEPLDPEDLGDFERFGDSWAARLSVLPIDGVELQVSHANVTSPEVPLGGGLDQAKWSVSARYETESIYALAEWARTAELRGDAEAYALPSILAEAAYFTGPWRFALRAERTKRTEDERTTSLFRSPWPHSDGHVFGFTTWQIYSGAVSREFRLGTLRAAPLVEVSHQRPQPHSRPSLFDPDELYGSTRLWSFNLGLQLGAGLRHSRMGRYGAAVQ